MSVIFGSSPDPNQQNIDAPKVETPEPSNRQIRQLSSDQALTVKPCGDVLAPYTPSPHKIIEAQTVDFHVQPHGLESEAKVIPTKQTAPSRKYEEIKQALVECSMQHLTTLAGEGELVHWVDKESNATALHLLCKHPGTERLIDSLIEQGIDVQAQDADGHSALHVACLSSHSLDIALRLVSTHHVDASQLPIGLQRALIRHAVEKGDSKTFDHLSKLKLPINTPYEDGKTLLHVLLSSRPIQMQIFSSLLLQGVNVDAVDAHGKTALFLACEANNKELFLQLIEKGASLPQEDSAQRFTLELFAAKNQCLEKFLKTSTIPQEKWNALLASAYEIGDLSTMRALLKHNATFDTERKNSSNQTLLQEALTEDPIDQKKIDKLLLLNANVQVLDSKGNSPLMQAVVKGDELIVQKLLNAGAKFCGKEGSEAVELAYQQRNVALLTTLLVQQKIELTEDNRKSQYLLLACQRGSIELVAHLLKIGVDATIVDDDEETIVQIAVKNDDFEMLSFICEESSLTNAQKISVLTAGNEPNEKPFAAACRKGKVSIAKYLADQMLKLDASDTTKRDLLAMAVDSRQTEVAKSLVQKGIAVDLNLLLEEMSDYQFEGEKIQLYLELGADSTTKNKNGQSLLEIAKNANDGKLFLFLILLPQAKPSKEEIQQGMMFAVKEQNLAMLKKIITTHSADPAFLDNETGQGLVHVAAGTDDSTMLHALVEEFHLEKQVQLPDKNGDTPLHIAFRNAQEPNVLFLLNLKASITTENAKKETPLDIALEVNDRFSSMAFEKLLETGATFRDKGAEKILQVAIIERNFTVVRNLIEKGYGKDLSDDMKAKCLFIVAQNGDFALVKELIDNRGAPSSELDKATGYGLVHFAAQGGNVEIMKYLKDLGMNLNRFQKNNETPLMVCCRNGHTEMAKFLIQEKAEVNEENNSNRTALHYAVESGSRPLIALLLNEKAKPDVQDIKGKTPLHVAAESERDSREVIRALREAGAQVDILDNEHKTPLQLAAQRGYFEHVSLLSGTKNTKLTPVTAEHFPLLCNQFAEYARIHNTSKVLFSDFLQKHGYECRLEGIDFTKFSYSTKELFQQIDFSGILFENVGFTGVNFSHSVFTNSRFENCTMQGCVFAQSELTGVAFVNCDLTDTLFEKAVLHGVSMRNSTLSFMGMSESVCSELLVSNCTLTGASFFKVTFDSKSKFESCDLSNCLLFDAHAQFNPKSTTETISRPVIAVSWNTQEPGPNAAKAVASFKAAKALPMKFNHFPDDSDIDTKKLAEEVQSLLELLKETKHQKEHIPQKLLEEALKDPKNYPQITTLMQRALAVVRQVDGILLPGGHDIEPEFYGQPRSVLLEPDADYRRTIYEFAVVNYARGLGVPLMGICRGSQLGNVFYGGTLSQDIEGHRGTIKPLTKIEPRGPAEGLGVIRSVAYGKEQDKAFIAESIHHQALRTIGDNLELVIEHHGIAKAIEGKSGVPLWLTQFHPESRKPTLATDASTASSSQASEQVSEQNYDLIAAFTLASDQYRRKKQIFRKPS